MPVPVPREHEAWLLGRTPDGAGAAPPADAGHEFLTWLRWTIAESGPAIVLVVQAQEARELVAVLARSESRLITVLTEQELAPA
jgi:hypothetical protein